MLYYHCTKELIKNVNLKCIKHRYLAFAFMPHHFPPFLLYLHCELHTTVMEKCSHIYVNIYSRCISVVKSKLNEILQPAQRYNFRVASMDTYVPSYFSFLSLKPSIFSLIFFFLSHLTNSGFGI